MSDQLDVPAVSGEPAATPMAGPTFAWRAAWLLAALGVLTLLAGLIVLGAGDRTVGQLVTAGMILAGAIGLLLLAWALAHGRPWAEPWARVALAIVIAAGVVHTVVGMASSSLWIPLDALLAIWALSAGHGVAPSRSMLRSAGPALVVLILVGAVAGPIGTLAAELTKPAPDPNAVIVVHNQSPRVVLVMVGDLSQTRTGTSFIASCGGVARIPVTSADYQPDGRLMAFIAIDPSGQLDAWSAVSPDPSETYLGSYSMTPIWSDGRLAGSLPLELVVHGDFSVDTSVPSATPCTPDPKATPAGG